MDIHISLDGHNRLAEQLHRQLGEHLARGSLPSGSALPSTRELAARLAVSRTTVIAAYDRLMADGLVESRAGAGYFVRDEPRPARPANGRQLTGQPRPAPVWDDVYRMPDMSAAATPYDFRPGVPAGRHFPYAKWRALLSAKARHSALGDGIYMDPAGAGVLREAIAHHVALSRAVVARPDDVVVTTGTQQAVDLVARAVLEPGDVVAMEDPGYPPVRALLTSHRARVVPVPVDTDGLVVDALPAAARLVYVTPSHQFPLGVTMSLERRRALLSWAADHGAVVVEDDYDSEYRYTGRPLDPLQSIDPVGCVVYVGSFSKILLPTFRVGFLVTVPSLAQALNRAKFVTDWHTNGLMQHALAEFITDGSMAKHVRKMRRVYLERHRLVVDGLSTDFADRFHVVPSAIGMHVTARLGADVRPREDVAMVLNARRHGVETNCLSAFSRSTPRMQGFVVGYGGIEAEHIPEGLTRLRRAVG